MAVTLGRSTTEGQHVVTSDCLLSSYKVLQDSGVGSG